MIDTNIILDVFLNRQGFYDESRKVLDLCEAGKIKGYITAKTFADINYLIHHYVHGKERTEMICENVLKIVDVLSVTDEDVYTAFSKKTNDFEDCLLAMSAIANKCDGIVTRDEKGFLNLGIKIYSPHEICEKFKNVLDD